MFDIFGFLHQHLQEEHRVEFEVLNPDNYRGKYAGEEIVRQNVLYLYRGYKAWMDLAELLSCRMMTPEKTDEYHVRLIFEKLDHTESFHKTQSSIEKYGVDSEFFKIHKNEEPVFLFSYKQALENVKIQKRKRVLDLGVNSGDEFALIKEVLDEVQYSTIELTGIDYSASAISYAQDRFPEDNVNFIEHDINALGALNLGKFDLIISIGTLQSPNIDFKPFFMSLIQNYLEEGGAVILGFPNCRWIDGEMVYGARVPNYNFSEMGMLYSDVMFCKKYLQQKKFRVTLTGKNYVFLTATKIGSSYKS